MSKYEVNFKRLGLLLLPTFWRKPLLAAFLYAGLSPLSHLHTRFVQFRRETNYRLTHNGQTCYLRAVLNDSFDPLERRITITDEAEGIGDVTLYKREVNREILVPKRNASRILIINRRGFSGANKVDFWINIPVALYGKIDLARLKALVNTYKLVSKRFSITYK